MLTQILAYLVNFLLSYERLLRPLQVENPVLPGIFFVLPVHLPEQYLKPTIPQELRLIYVEKYLHSPVEQEIGQHFKTAIARDSVVEIGNLMSTWKGSSLLLFILLTGILSRIEREWVVFTVTKEVESLLAKMQFEQVYLADADINKLEDEQDQWGRYYDDKPKVMFGNIAEAIDPLKNQALAASIMHQFTKKMDQVALSWQANLAK